MLRGLKENIIMGHLIPAGTGFGVHRDITIVKSASDETKKEEPAKEKAQTVAEQQQS